MRFPSRNEVEAIRKFYPKGCRVELITMDDPQAPEPGTLGTVRVVDDAGTVFVDWDNGSSLGIVFGQDNCRRR